MQLSALAVLVGEQNYGDEMFAKDDAVPDLAPMVSDAISGLTDERLRLVLHWRMGLVEGPSTLQGIGEQLGISRERVRQLESKALTRIGRRRKNTLAQFINLLASSDQALALTLVETAERDFRCEPACLARTVCRMAGLTVEHAQHIAALASQDLSRRRQELLEEKSIRRQETRADMIVGKWIHDAQWPETLALPQNGSTVRRRMPQTDSIGHIGSFESKKLGRRVYFESRLEESALVVAERSTLVATFQEQPFEISYAAAEGRRTFFPDMLISLADGRLLLIEIKPLWQIAVTVNRIKHQAGQRFAAANGLGWTVVADRGRTDRDLYRHDINDFTRRALGAALSSLSGPISWPTMQELRQIAPITSLDVAAYAVQHNVELSLTPYRLG